MEALVVVVLDRVPAVYEVLVPSHERGIVVHAEVVPVLQDERPSAAVVICFAEGSSSSGRCTSRSRVVSGVTCCARWLEQHEAVVLERPVGDLHEGAVVILPDVLEHADGHDPVDDPEIPR